MQYYYDNLNDEKKAYFKILSSEFPEWLFEYIDTPEMQRIHKISQNCGTDYCDFFNIRYKTSNLDHSVGVALIIWNFTHDKKQTLSGLFHDIATPVFKHCIDFMNGDFEKQESTEERTTDIIKNSKEIMELLKRDGIELEEVNDYKKYPIADNETPRLSSDRFEYTFSSGLSFFRVWELDLVQKVYDNIIVVKNEDGLDELAFKDKDVCEEYINTASRIWPKWVSDEDRTVMQFIADMCRSMNISGYLTIEDLYTLSEDEVVDRFLNCKDTYLSESFKKFQKITAIHKSDIYVPGKYCVNILGKIRYVSPLVLTDNGPQRIYDISENAKNKIDGYLNMPKGGNYYTYIDLDFTPYKETRKN